MDVRDSVAEKGQRKGGNIVAFEIIKVKLFYLSYVMMEVSQKNSCTVPYARVRNSGLISLLGSFIALTRLQLCLGCQLIKK